MTARHIRAEAAMRAVTSVGIRSGKSMREIVVDLYGTDRVAAGWHGDSGMRAKVRRLVQRARAASGERPGNAGPGTP